MEIRHAMVPSSKHALKCPHPMTPIGICVHNTANDASAVSEISYMVSNASQTSFHFAVDDKEVVQGLLLDRNGWHAGDGANGPGNRKHIAVEICYSKTGGERFTKAEDNAAQLIAELLIKYKWGIEQVKKHQDFSGKNCPTRTLELGWGRFLDKVKKYMKPEGGNMSDVPQELQRFGKGTISDLAKYIDELRGFVDGGNREILDIKKVLKLDSTSSHDAIIARISALLVQNSPSTPPSTPTAGLPEVPGFELEELTFKRKA